MRMTISRKLVSGFLSLALLVLIAGLVGIIVLNKVSSSADTVAKEKAPTQYAVMNAALSVDIVQKHTVELTSSVFKIEEISSQISSAMAEFDMWIAMLQYGTTSSEFTDGPAQQTYLSKKLKLIVPQSSEEMLPIVNNLVEKSSSLKNKTKELATAHQKKINFGVLVNSQVMALPDFLNLAQRTHIEWTKTLKDAVNIETKFTGNMDPNKGIIGEWINSYDVPNEELMKLMGHLKKQHIKLLALAVKINGMSAYKDKQRSLNRGIATTAKIERDFIKLHALSKAIYGELGLANKQKEQGLSATVKTINNQLQELIAIADTEMQTALNEAAAAKRSGITVLLVLTVVAVVVAIFLGTIVSRFMSSRISSIAESTKNIANGDLQKELKIDSNDELGDLAGDTNVMITNLRKMIGKINIFSEDLTKSADDLSGISKNLGGNANELEGKSGAASEATATMNESMVDISTLANDSMQRVQSVALATEEMSSTITEISQNTEQARSITNTAVKTVENTTVKMNELSNAATEIGKVAEVIGNIAEQTNLLSLNATIEAARAGDAGKGFAVVANEVKELAGQTNKATVDIRDKIVAIQESSDNAISEITEITETINNINSIVVMIAGAVEEQAVTTKQITDDINSVSTGIEGMSEHVDSATHISDSVASDIDQVKVTSQSIGKGSRLTQESATELEKLAGDLNQLIGQFKL